MTETEPTMSKKYELTDEKLDFKGRVLSRIRALRMICARNGEVMVHEGELGGWVESERNLSHDGECWVFHDAKVFGDAVVSENAFVHEKAMVAGNAMVYGWAVVGGRSRVTGYASLHDHMLVAGGAFISNVDLCCHSRTLESATEWPEDDE